MHTMLAALDLRDPIWGFWINAGSLLLSALAILVTVVLALRSRQRKLLTYEIVSNTSVINVENDVGEDLEILVEKHPVTKVRLHVIKVVNAGNTTIEPEDYPHPLQFQFKDAFSAHPLIRCAISKTEPDTLIPPDQLKSIVSLDMVNQSFITLKVPMLNPRDAIILRVLLMARDRRSTQMEVFGHLRGGTIKQSSSAQPRIARRAVIIGVLIAFAFGLLLSNSIGIISSFALGNCSFGSIKISGSTSFYNTAQAEADKYTGTCPIASLNISESSSGSGLSDLQSEKIAIANSEISAPASANLLDHQVAGIVFALVVNKNLHITNLSTQQIQGIYNGTYTDWSQLGHDGSLPIKVFGRSSSSGTHRAFVQYVLGNTSGSGAGLPPGASIVDRSDQVVSSVAADKGGIGYTDLGDADNNSAAVTILEIDQHAPTPGLVENGTYPFWAIEHMYTASNPPMLATSFINYVMHDMQSNPSFIRKDDISASVLSSHSS